MNISTLWLYQRCLSRFQETSARICQRRKRLWSWCTRHNDYIHSKQPYQLAMCKSLLTSVRGCRRYLYTIQVTLFVHNYESVNNKSKHGQNLSVLIMFWGSSICSAASVKLCTSESNKILYFSDASVLPRSFENSFLIINVKATVKKLELQLMVDESSAIAEIVLVGGRYVVQGHSRWLMLVPIGSSYMTSC